MKKYIMAVLQIITILHGMEKPETSPIPHIYSVCEWNKEHYDKGQTPLELAHHHMIAKENLEELIIFNVTINKGFAEHLAEKAAIVHSVDEEFSLDIETTQRKYNHLRNLAFLAGALSEYYDLFAAFQLPSEEKMLRKDLLSYAGGLRARGEIFGSIITQANDDPFEEIVAQNIYTEICNLLPKEDQQRREKIIYSKENFITQEILEKVINETGYEIISQTNRFFDIHIKNVSSLKKLLSEGFSEFLSEKFTLSKYAQEHFCRKYIKSFIQHLKENQQQKCVYPYNFMEIHLRKK